MRGLRFECQPGCTACCERQGFVYLTEEDIERAARYLGMQAKTFERRFIYRTKNLRRLRMPASGKCRFLRAGGCSIHPAKPTQCRLFPFWPEVTASARAWRQTGKWCPGIGKGDLVQIKAAGALEGEMRAAYPSMYP